MEIKIYKYFSENLVLTLATFWLVLELKEKNSILDQGLNLGLQLYLLVL